MKSGVNSRSSIVRLNHRANKRCYLPTQTWECIICFITITCYITTQVDLNTAVVNSIANMYTHSMKKKKKRPIILQPLIIASGHSKQEHHYQVISRHAKFYIHANPIQNSTNFIELICSAILLVLICSPSRKPSLVTVHSGVNQHAHSRYWVLTSQQPSDSIVG